MPTLEVKDHDIVDGVVVSPNCVVGRRGGFVKWVVMHTMEAPETANTAENVAGYFANPAAQASAQYCVDSDSIIQCVDELDYAFAAATTGNMFGIHIELAGYAAQDDAGWSDEFSQAMLDKAAALTASICRKHGIPPRFLPDAQLAAGEKGITTHGAISRVFRESDHTAPGPNFPARHFINLVNQHLGNRIAAQVNDVIENGEEMSEKVLEEIRDELKYFNLYNRPGEEGKHFDGQAASWQRNISNRATIIADALTPGLEHVKFEGFIYGFLRQILDEAKTTNSLLARLVNKIGA